MKTARFILLAALVANIAVAFVAEAKGILPCMVYRYGLTNEQIDGILEKHPDAQLRISAQDWRGMKYELYRFHNMTNYVEQIGNSNDCARILLRLHDGIETLNSSNSFLRLEVKRVENRIADYIEAYDSATNAFNIATNYIADLKIDLTIATNRVAIAEAKEAAAEARAARLDAFRDYLVEQRDKAILPSTKAIYQALIDKIDEKTGGK